MKIGLYGGTFDPIHNAHLIIAQYVKEELNLSKVVFVPSAHPPHKDIHLAADLRWKLVNLAIADNPQFETSDIEMKQKGVTYSVDTISALKHDLGIPQKDLYWIIGSDNLFTFQKWRNPEGILKLCTLAVFPRSQDDLRNMPAGLRENLVYLKDAPRIEISSTTVRSLIQSGRCIKYLVPPAVEAFILSEKLYR